MAMFLAPGIAERIAFQTLKEDETFFLFNKKNKDLVKLFRDNLVGGPAIIFDRFQKAKILTLSSANTPIFSA